VWNKYIEWDTVVVPRSFSPTIESAVKPTEFAKALGLGCASIGGAPDERRCKAR
jgi:hypothetical protein